MSADPPAVLRIVSGSPTPEELALLTAVVAAAATGADAPEAEQDVQRGRWNDPRHSHRPYLPTGPNAWYAAYR